MVYNSLMRPAHAPVVRNRKGRIQKPCLLCQKLFETVQSQIRHRRGGKYCSRKCWLKARRAPQSGRICTTCKTYKKARHFGVNPQHPPRLRSHCKECRCRREKIKRERIPPTERLNKRLLRLGLGIHGYVELLEKQGHRCAICKTTVPGNGHVRFVVDHDHKTGAARGLLCSNCNRGLGLFQDSISILLGAAAYLRP